MFDFTAALKKLETFEQTFSQMIQMLNLLNSTVSILKADNDKFKADNEKLMAALNVDKTEA